MTSRDDAVDVWVDGDHELGEGARWVDGRLVFVDILSGRLFEADAGGTRELARLDVPLGAVAPVRGRPGHWIAAAGTGIALLGPDGGLDWLARPEDGGPVRTRMNDGVCDPAGRFWAGSMAYDGTPGAGSLYRIDTDGSVHRVLTGLDIVNGPAFTAAGDLLYVADSAAGVVYRCAVDAGGTLSTSDVFVRLAEDTGSPDGMTVDAEGCLWVAIWGGGAVHRYRPDGTLAAAVVLPVAQPTSVCLAPPGLLVTTARHGLADPAPPAGAILAVRVAATAPAACAYGA